MVRLCRHGQLTVAAAAHPAHQPVSLFARPGGIRVGYLDAAVAVDVLGRQLAVGKDRVGHAGGAAGQRQIHQPQLRAEHQNVRDRHALLVHTGDEQCRRVGVHPSADHAAPVQGRHAAGQHAAVGHAHLLVLPAVELRHRLAVAVGTQHQQAGDAVAVQILHGKAVVAAGHERHRLPLHGVHRHSLYLGADTPAHDQLPAAVAVEILIVHAVDGAAAALDGAEAGVCPVLQTEYKYFQGLFVAAHTEEGQRLLLSVAVQIHHLDGLDVPSAGRRGVFVALGDQVVQFLCQPCILLRHAGQGEQLLHRGVGKAAPGQQRRQQRRQTRQQDISFHTPQHGTPSSRPAYSHADIIPHLPLFW